MFFFCCNVFVAQAAGLWLAALPVARGGILGTGGVCERERENSDRASHLKKKKKKKQRQREPVSEKIIACNSVLEPSGVAITGRCGGAALARHGARGMQGGIQFQPFHFCAHCEGQTLTGTISLPSPILCLPASALTQQCSYTDL